MVSIREHFVTETTDMNWIELNLHLLLVLGLSSSRIAFEGRTTPLFEE